MGLTYNQEFEPGRIYHIYNRSVGKELLFRETTDYLRFLGLINKYLAGYGYLWAYCLMPNHFHLLWEVGIKPRLPSQEGTSLAEENIIEGEGNVNMLLIDQFKRLFSAYALGYNSKYSRHGALFQNRFKRIAIQSEWNLIRTLCYIHHNPIHHGFTSQYQSWKFCSFNYFMENKKEPAKPDTIRVLNWMGNGDLRNGMTRFKKYHFDYMHQHREEKQ